MKASEKASDPENWSNDGEFVCCRQDDCHFFLRKKGKKRRLLCRIFPDKVQLKCDSCGQISTFFFDKSKNYKDKIDEPSWIPLSSLIAEWEQKPNAGNR